MLILARRAGEAVLLGPDVRITVLEIDGRTVRFGIEAPGSVMILRAELADRLASENRNSVASVEAVERLGLAPAAGQHVAAAPGQPAGRSRRRKAASDGTTNR